MQDPRRPFDIRRRFGGQAEFAAVLRRSGLDLAEAAEHLLDGSPLLERIGGVSAHVVEYLGPGIARRIREPSLERGQVAAQLLLRLFGVHPCPFINCSTCSAISPHTWAKRLSWERPTAVIA